MLETLFWCSGRQAWAVTLTAAPAAGPSRAKQLLHGQWTAVCAGRPMLNKLARINGLNVRRGTTGHAMKFESRIQLPQPVVGTLPRARENRCTNSDVEASTNVDSHALWAKHKASNCRAMGVHQTAPASRVGVLRSICALTGLTQFRYRADCESTRSQPGKAPAQRCFPASVRLTDRQTETRFRIADLGPAQCA